MRIFFVFLSLIVLSISSWADETELSLQERKEKLETCLSVCGGEHICTTNCNNAFGEKTTDSEEDTEEEEEDECD